MWGFVVNTLVPLSVFGQQKIPLRLLCDCLVGINFGLVQKRQPTVLGVCWTIMICQLMALKHSTSGVATGQCQKVLNNLAAVSFAINVSIFYQSYCRPHNVLRWWGRVVSCHLGQSQRPGRSKPGRCVPHSLLVMLSRDECHVLTSSLIASEGFILNPLSTLCLHTHLPALLTLIGGEVWLHL